MVEKNFDVNNENCVEWLSGEHYAVVSFTNKKHINRIKKIYEERKDEFKYFVENKDGSVCAKIPMKWVKINPGAKPGSRTYTPSPERIKAATEALAKWREQNQKNKGT